VFGTIWARMDKPPARRIDGPRLSYIRGFDGLRAISAFGVIGFHLQLPGFSLGQTGVYLFFVLSGFLITRILISAKDQPAYFSRFWTRRARRIFPIYYLLFGFVIAWGLWKGWPMSDWPWFAFYLQNFKLAISQWQPAFPLMMSHTWTLASEEQFYWLWPIVVFAFPPRIILRVAAGLICAAVLCRAIIATVSVNPYLVFAPLPCTVDFLAWGALAAVLHKSGTARPSLMLIIFSALLITTGTMIWHRGLDAFWSPDIGLSVTYGAILLGLLGPLFVTLLFLVQTSPLLASVLEINWLRYLGRISYGLYLYHLPTFFFADRMAERGWLFLSEPTPKVVLTIAIAVASYELIERPILGSSTRPEA
jgi:peptidoglycan/LPS O-acetylase OafA/YrhL